VLRHHDSNPVADELAIRDLVARCCDAANQHDAHRWEACWVDEDAHWDVAGHIFQGRTAVVEHWRSVTATYRFTFQMVTTGQVAVDGDRATGRWYVQEHNERRDGTVAELWAWYDDRYQRAAEGWRLASRVLHLVDATRR